MKNKNNRKILSIISILMYLLSSIVLITFIILSVKGNFINFNGEVKPAPLIAFATIFCLTIYLGSFFNYKSSNNNKKLNQSLIIYLIIYLALFYFFTNIDRGINFGPTGRLKFNLIPFKGIIEIIISAIKNMELNALIQIVGNFLILVPLAYLYPRIFDRTKKLSWFIPFILASTFIIELSQLLFGGGIFDIDDIILNSLGPICFFTLFNNSFLSKTLDKLLLQENIDIKLKDTTKSIIVLIIATISFALCIYFYWYYDFAISYEIKNLNLNNICEEEKILIYEDEYYLYYGCKNIEDIYLIVNEKYKYPIKDVLDGKVKSKYVKTITGRDLKYNDYFELKAKYPVIEVKYDKKNVSISPNNINNEYYHFGDITFENEASYTIYKALLVPKKEGKEILSFDIFWQENHELIDTITYEITIDSELNLSYKIIDNKKE